MRICNLAAVMRTMGHRDVKTAMHYQHPELEIVRAALDCPAPTSKVAAWQIGVYDTLCDTPKNDNLGKSLNTWQVGENGFSWPDNRPSVEYLLLTCQSFRRSVFESGFSACLQALGPSSNCPTTSAWHVSKGPRVRKARRATA
jgi:hypothetical protein